MRRRHHRQFGLPNANQILLCMVVCALLFFALLRRHWLQFTDDPDVHASLKSVYVVGETSTDSKSWQQFCADDSFKMNIPGTNRTVTVVDMQDGAVLCHKHSGAFVPTVMVWILAVGLSGALLSTLMAVYLQLGNPTREIVFWVGMLPGILLFGTAVLGTAALLVWQRFYLRFDNGDCFSITVAATVIAYASAISMVIRWRWPGICAVPNEQQALGSRAYGDQLPPRRRRRRGSATTAPTVTGTPAHDLESAAVPLNR
ncbi:DNA polymerase epsilon subunit [Phytophthora cinnamomi]|uniref:DNA polymerase epsilon subunit n=1 Tax=Phytophthora cinnamomi TaxID=4785 RepID=UPI00355938B1|nr:DNA polymerase epsilon subunit [Phytophthora cinnamomi]